MKKFYYIQAWGYILGSFPYYVNRQIADARADNAPDNATHKNNDGTWSTTDSIVAPDTVQRLDTHVAYLKKLDAQKELRKNVKISRVS